METEIKITQKTMFVEPRFPAKLFSQFQKSELTIALSEATAVIPPTARARDKVPKKKRFPVFTMANKTGNPMTIPMMIQSM